MLCSQAPCDWAPPAPASPHLPFSSAICQQPREGWHPHQSRVAWSPGPTLEERLLPWVIHRINHSTVCICSQEQFPSNVFSS